MADSEKTIVVAGDATIDWFLYPVRGLPQGRQWERRPAMHSCALPGGVFMLADFIDAACRSRGAGDTIVSPDRPSSLRTPSPEKILHGNAILSEEGGCLRVAQSLGFVGPQRGAVKSPKFSSNPKQADVLVLDDVGNGFRNEPGAWPKAVEAAGDTIVIHKQNQPLMEGRLWSVLVEKHCPTHIAVVNADDLRAFSGVDISESLCWERTAKDLMYHMQMSEELHPFRTCAFIVVLFGTDGAVIYRTGDAAQATLVFDAHRLEGGFEREIAGTMHGLTTAFTAALAAHLAEAGLQAIESGVTAGLASARALLAAGFEKTGGDIRYPLDRIFGDAANQWTFASCRIEPPSDLHAPDPDHWRILDQCTRNSRILVAEETVVDGKSSILAGAPAGKFGKLETIDRVEIESYNAIRRLIVEFLDNPSPARPLSFAVFGPPGSGKSFGVKQVLASIGNKSLATETFNLSQFQSYQDLVSAFHRVRDVALSGKIPFVFFDEFDSGNQDGPLGWLKYLLAPMQDAEFKEGGETHPIGKAIFVFAGGTCSTFEEFSTNAAGDEDDDQQAEQRFKLAKGPDFVSRLRGFINVMGPNRQGPDDDAYIIRRAKVLRAMLQFNPKAQAMFTHQKRLRIDRGVLRALLHVSKYKHGTRSMEAIFDMSQLAGRERFDLAALPPRDQLDLHVDADEFLFLTQRERFLTLTSDQARVVSAVAGEMSTPPPELSLQQAEQRLVEKAARGVHEEYLRQVKQIGKTPKAAGAFDELPREIQMSNANAAESIPYKLRSIGCGIRLLPPGQTPLTPTITDAEVDRLAQMEHERWCRERKLQGFIYSEAPIPGRKTSEYLKPYCDLPDEIKQLDVLATFSIPVILWRMGFELYRMEEFEALSDPVLVDRLARIVHDNYVQNRVQAGDTIETNTSLAAFDDLPEDLQASNVDSAESVPRKLRRIGYGVRRVPPGGTPRRIELTDEQIEAMSELEHARWNWQRILQGWTYKDGPKDEKNKTTPYLVPWDELDDEIKEYDRETVRLIPELLCEAGYEAYKL